VRAGGKGGAEHGAPRQQEGADGQRRQPVQAVVPDTAARHGPGFALGEDTGTTSYHLGVLADAGIIEEVTERAHSRERWWRTIPVDLREPDYDSLSPADRAALDERRAGQIPGELTLVNRFVRDMRKHHGWAKASRASGYYTAEDLDAFFDEYSELLARYGHDRNDAPPGARLMQLRMFYIPDEPAEPEP
jgi:hypothetical protein